MLRTIVVDDHALSARGLAAALEATGRFSVVALADTGLEGIARTKILQPDLVIFDMLLPDVNGLEAVIEARRWSSDTRFAILTGGASPQQLRGLLDHQIQGIFLKTTAPESICQGLLELCAGAQVIDPLVADILARHDENRKSAAQLTEREIEVLHGIARGLPNVQIAQHLGLSAKTIDSHRTKLMAKLGVHSTAALIVRAVRDGLIDLGQAG